MSDSMPGPDTAAGTAPAQTAQDAPQEPSAPVPHLPADPAPLGVVRTPTGHAEVDARLERLADADHLPADGHIEVYEDVHGALRDALTALDARPGPAPVPAPTPSYNNSYNNRS
ncbi:MULTISPECIES: hypothetical protein [unclassified Streptomyces]|uniref:hypothetical protein n=1 Tax=unclassified Streptomyces TaxID=2593676 RepID=UPI002256B523|nr:MULTISPECIES: hypothetical protein [unclassified Streptomyces]MCX5139330.1 hypothetical protein [Streptomyces sp. NBC_00338]WRZ64014.1 hypothetical protein OG408_09000 [Streptomyces sp. NBC_01257]WSU57977.1 hypothetical protein OG450_08965 [Streptomyces sp. NBC_01104]